MLRIRIALPVTLIVVAMALVAWGFVARAQGTATVSGVVLDANGPVAGATVRQKLTANATTSADDGTFLLGGLTEGITTTITAWKDGYLVGWVTLVPPSTGATIPIRAHYTTDNPDYVWYSSHDLSDPLACAHCMVAYPQWEVNAHANSATNPRFFSLYNGTTIDGSASAAPGFKMDFPEQAGNCATCHAPAAAVQGTRSFMAADMNELQGVQKEGVFCEFCHKVGEVYLNPATGLPYDNAPGVLSMRLYRPETGGPEQLFFGPFDDVTRRVAYSSLEKSSQFCAPCHQFSFWGTPIYESYREWLESPYAAQGKQCQACHMKPTGVDHFVYLDQGGLIRDPNLIASHLQPGAANVELLQNTVAMTVTSAAGGLGEVTVTVAITNTEAGHDVPTDSPGRQMILTVSASDQEGRSLALAAGPRVPTWGGAEAGQPGKIYAKVLRDVLTGEAPVMSYWKQTVIESDNRIPAFGSDASTYHFAVPLGTSRVQIKAELKFRRAFQSVMDAKEWDVPDIMMEERALSYEVAPLKAVYLPLASR